MTRYFFLGFLTGLMMLLCAFTAVATFLPGPKAAKQTPVHDGGISPADRAKLDEIHSKMGRVMYRIERMEADWQAFRRAAK
jgi:hypothetical protein